MVLGKPYIYIYIYECPERIHGWRQPSLSYCSIAPNFLPERTPASCVLSPQQRKITWTTQDGMEFGMRFIGCRAHEVGFHECSRVYMSRIL